MKITNFLLAFLAIAVIIMSCEKGKVSNVEPTKPNGLILDTISAGTIKLNWQKISGGADVINVYREVGRTKKELLGCLPITSTSYTDYEFPQDTTKVIKFIVQTTIENEYSEANYANFMPFMLKSPYNTHLEFIDTNNILLTWDCDSRFSDGFLIKYTNNNIWLTNIAHLGRDTRNFTVTWAPIIATTFKIISYSREIESENANATRATTVMIRIIQ